MAQGAKSKSTLQVRMATAADMAAMISLVNTAFEVESFLEGTRTDAQRMSEMMQKGQFLVGAQDGNMVASVYVEVRGDRAYLGMLAVDPSRQGSGVGRLMGDAVEAYCREQGCKYLDLTVLSLRSELLPFYRKLGFVETGTEEFHPPFGIKDGLECHKIVMTKPL